MIINHIYDYRKIAEYSYRLHASWRNRCYIPGVELKKLGHSVFLQHEKPKSGACIYHKHQNIYAVEWLKDTSGVVDITDDYFTDRSVYPGQNYVPNFESIRDDYKRKCELADIITCPTKIMASKIFEHTGRESVIIPDPIDLLEFEYVKPEYKGFGTVCWFGNHDNLLTLIGRKLSYPGEIVTTPNLSTNYKLGRGWTITHWQPEVMKTVFTRHDIVVIPYADYPWQLTKSPNRIVDSLLSGKIVVVNDTPVVDAYNLREFVVVNNVLDEGVAWAMENNQEALERTKRGQQHIFKELNSEKIGKLWETTLANCKRLGE